MKKKVISYGESLVDFLPDSRGPLRSVERFYKSIGGAPTNASVGMARLGLDIGLMGQVGADEFGGFVVDSLASEGVRTEGVTFTESAKTGITFITLSESGDRSFLFFREPSADMTITRDDINIDLLAQCDVFLFGSNLLTAEPAREATLHAVETARSNGALVVMDVNYRPHLWTDPELAFKSITDAIQFVDVLKVNEIEFAFLFKDPERAVEFAQGGKTLLLTEGEHGAKIMRDGSQAKVETRNVEVVDTTGAGDGFISGTITAILKLTADSSPTVVRDWSDFENWRRIARVGCYIGSCVCTGLGATTSLPHENEIPWDELLT